MLDDEIDHLTRLWRQARVAPDGDTHASLLGQDTAAQLDRFDAVQLQDVIAVCRSARSLCDAGRQLFAVSRATKSKPNDADRLKKYLARFVLDWEQL